MAVAVAAGVMVLGQSGDDGGSGPPPGITLDDLDVALLTQADVGAGFVPDTPGDDESSVPGDDRLDGSDDCDEALATFEDADAFDQSTSVAFSSDGGEGPGVENEITLPSAGSPTVGDMRDAMGQCETIAFDDPGVSGEMTIDTDEIDGLGDGAFSVTMNVSADSPIMPFEVEVYGVVWERDGIVATVTGSGGFDTTTFSAPSVDHDWVNGLAAVVDERIAEVVAV